MPEGSVIYAGQPVMNVRAPMIEGQIPETYLLSAITFETLVASKAARISMPPAAREVVEFGTRRAHTPEAGVLGARAAYIGGCAGTSNTLAGMRYGIPVMGTAAHSWVLSFPPSRKPSSSCSACWKTRPCSCLTPTTPSKPRNSSARMGGPLWGVRLDSGDFLALSREVRRILPDAKIMASGDLDETKIAWLLEQGAPIDAFGVGTELAVSGDAPSMGAVYKLVEIEQEGHIRHTAKRSPDKATIPGAKQLFRYPEYDLLSLHDECAGGAKAMLEPWILGGNLIRDLPSVEDIRDRAQKNLAEWPAGNRRTELSIDLKELNESVLRH